MKNIFLSLVILFFTSAAVAQVDTTAVQPEESTKKGGFQKDHLFTGGGITLSFSSYGTVLGASPVFGYSITKWLDAGFVVNFIYATQRHYAFYSVDDKLKQTIIGPGAFVRVFPVKFLFLQGQVEKNFIRQTLVPDDNSIPKQTYKIESNSLLVGGGYCNGREGSGEPFYYISLLFDVAKDKNSPYVEVTDMGKINALPIVRAGVQIPLFQGRGLF
jgi:hypothetical protein